MCRENCAGQTSLQINISYDIGLDISFSISLQINISYYIGLDNYFLLDNLTDEHQLRPCFGYLLLDILTDNISYYIGLDISFSISLQITSVTTLVWMSPSRYPYR